MEMEKSPGWVKGRKSRRYDIVSCFYLLYSIRFPLLGFEMLSRQCFWKMKPSVSSKLRCPVHIPHAASLFLSFLSVVCPSLCFSLTPFMLSVEFFFSCCVALNNGCHWLLCLWPLLPWSPPSFFFFLCSFKYPRCFHFSCSLFVPRHSISSSLSLLTLSGLR